MDAKTPDGRYDRTHAWVPQVSPKPLVPRWQYLGPFASNEERLTQQAVNAAVIPGAELAEMVRTPIPQINLFPERFGYDRTIPGILDIIEVGRKYTDPRVSWFSGGVAGYSGASRNSLAGN